MEKTRQTEAFSKLFDSSYLLSRQEAAKYLGITPRTLAVWACVKRYNLPYVKMSRLFKYRRSVLDDFVERRTITQPE
jgi:excisionase family DNA binding protein